MVVMNVMRMCIGLAILAACGCTNKIQTADSASSTARPTKMTAATMPSGRNPSAKAIRIDAGSSKPFVDAEGNTWQPDKGFSGGGMVNRGNIQIENTRNPGLYRTEHWGMNAFSIPVPNGRYNVLLHFAETY